MVAASFLNSPSGGWVASEVAVTCADQRCFELDPCDRGFVPLREDDLRVLVLAGINRSMMKIAVSVPVLRLANRDPQGSLLAH